jgi:tripartite-type tricarboxylate transporter receptor subunit TctC
MKLRSVFILALASVVYAPVAALAQGAYPSKPVRILVGFAPGGGSDILARALAQPLSEALEQQVVVDNRPGAGGVIAAELAMRSPPDGYTLLLGSPGAFTINPNLLAKIPYDPVRDFTPIGTFATLFYIVGVHPSLPVKSLRELLALAKAKPGQIAFGSSGQGANIHLAIEQFSRAAGIRMMHVPYKGNAPMLTGLMSGEVALVFDPMPTSMPLVKSGRMKALAVTAASRSSLLPELPTVSEAGVPGYEATNWFAIFAPAKTPDAIVSRLNGAMGRVMKNPTVRQRFQSQGAEPYAGSSEDLGRLVRTELAKYARIIQEANIRAE